MEEGLNREQRAVGDLSVVSVCHTSQLPEVTLTSGFVV
jgi:hypothetical protein